LAAIPGKKCGLRFNIEALLLNRFATITYYLQNREKVDAYLEAWREYSEQARRGQERNPSEVIKRLRQLKETKARLPGNVA
jgi:uncharacterized membrane protein (DUF106 family)